MTATSRAPRRPRIRPRGPPPAPTPIRTARGARSAAADERVLAEFLEASLRVPDLALPPRTKRFSFPPPPAAPREVSAQALASGDADAASAAAECGGAFVVAGAIDAREVREAVEAASAAVFAAPEEVKRELARWFRRRRDPADGEEFCWLRPVSSDQDRALGAALPGSTYRELREKMDMIAMTTENVAKNAIRVLSDNVKNPKDSALPREAPSILCLTLYNSNKSITCWNESGSTDPPPKSHALSIHLSGGDRQICLRNQGGSNTFCLPAGSMLVTVGKQVQEWSNGQFKTAVGEVLFEMTDEPGPFMSLVELVYSPDELHLSEVGRQARRIDRPKFVSFRDQILVALILLLLFYLFWR